MADPHQLREDTTAGMFPNLPYHLSPRSIRTLILRSKVPGTFCAGADLKERKSMSTLDVEKFLSQLRDTCTKIQNLPFPTITALDGLAMGGGMELSLCTDLRVAGE